MPRGKREDEKTLMVDVSVLAQRGQSNPTLGTRRETGLDYTDMYALDALISTAAKDPP